MAEQELTRFDSLTDSIAGVIRARILKGEYKIGEKIRIRFTGDGATLFSRVNGRLVETGKLTVK